MWNPEPIELRLGDLIVFEGNPRFTSLVSRCVYKVVGKEPTGAVSLSKWSYTFRCVYDMFPKTEPPDQCHHCMTTGKPPAELIKKNGTNGIRVLELLDVLLLRNELDSFIRSRARELGEEGPASR